MKSHFGRILIVALCGLGGFSLWANQEHIDCDRARANLAGQHPEPYETNDGPFYVSAEVMPNESGYFGDPIPGRRTLDITLSLRNKKERSTQLSGKAEFKKVLEHFAGKFDQIQGLWIQETSKNGLSDNLTTFNQLVSGPNPLSPVEAARQTWTGQQAYAAGFTKVVIVELKGKRGVYSLVRVLFQKPQ